MKIVIRGSGDVASAVAHRLFALGHTVLIHEVAQPAYTRRGMAFTDAVFDGKVGLQGVWAKHPQTVEDLRRMLVCGRAIPVYTGALEDALRLLPAEVLIDARMKKRSLPERQIGLAPLTIGLGPNFCAGDNVDLAIETAWGEALGRILETGATLPLAGEPRAIEGLARERCVYAARAGVWRTALAIGAWVEAGAEVARLDDLPVHAPVSGRVRGLCHDAVAVSAGSKILEIDPRRGGDDTGLFGLGERPQRIAAAVVQALARAHAIAPRCK